MITRIDYQNLKGRTAGLDLSPMTVLTGPQGSGKTSIIDAIQIGLLGYHPDLGKTSKGLFRLSTGDAMTISLHTHEGVITKNWKPTGKSIKATSLGATPAINAGALDAAAFVQATPTARAAMIRGLYPSAEDPREAMKTAVTAAAPTLRINWPPATDDLSEWREGVVAAIKAAGNAAKETADRMRASLEAASQLGQDDTTLPEPDTKATLAAMLVAMESATAARNALAETDAAILDAENRAAEPCSDPTATLGDLPEQLATLRFQLADAEAQQRAATKASEAAQKMLGTLRAHERTIARFNENYPQPLAEPTEPLAIVVPDFGAYNQSIQDHEAAKSALSRALAAQEEADICPHCGAGREHWSKQQQHAPAPDDAQIEALRSKENFAAARRSQMEAMVGDYNEHKAAAAEARATYQAQMRIWQDYSVERAHAQAAQAALDALPEPPPTGDEAEHLAIEIDNLEADIAAIETRIETARAAATRRAALEQLAELNDSRAWAAEELATAEEQHAKATAAHEQATQAALAIAAATQRKQHAKEARAAIEQADADNNAANTALVLMKTEFTRLASAALDPLLVAANRYLEGLALDPLSAIGLEIGRWKGEQWITFDVFSGGEKALATCAMQAAIAEANPHGWRIAFIDEFNTVSGEGMRDGFLRNLATAIDDQRLDQTLVLDNRPLTEAEQSAATPKTAPLMLHGLLLA